MYLYIVLKLLITEFVIFKQFVCRVYQRSCEWGVVQVERVSSVERREGVGFDLIKIYYTHFKELKINNI